jgi:3-methyladenine DNA glycosylase Mpg
MTLDFTKPIQTRDGKPVEIITTNARGAKPVKGYIGKSEILDAWNKDGIFGSMPSDFDLVNGPEQVTIYLNVYKHENGFDVYGHKNIDKAKLDASSGLYARVKVTFMERQFDD